MKKFDDMTEPPAQDAPEAGSPSQAELEIWRQQMPQLQISPIQKPAAIGSFTSWEDLTEDIKGPAPDNKPKLH